MSKIAPRPRSAKKRAELKTVTIDLALVKRFERLLTSLLDEDMATLGITWNQAVLLLGRCKRAVHDEQHRQEDEAAKRVFGAVEQQRAQAKQSNDETAPRLEAVR